MFDDRHTKPYKPALRDGRIKFETSRGYCFAEIKKGCLEIDEDSDDILRELYSFCLY